MTSGQVRVDRAQAARARRLAHRGRDAVRAEDQERALGHLGGLVDEDRALRAQLVDHVPVVHDLVAHVDRRAEARERELDDLDRAVDAGAEAARVGEQDLHRARA